jgi:hypothetical protein
MHVQMVALKLDKCYFFDAYLHYWEGSPVKYFLYVKSGGVSPVSISIKATLL